MLPEEVDGLSLGIVVKLVQQDDVRTDLLQDGGDRPGLLIRSGSQIPDQGPGFLAVQGRVEGGNAEFRRFGRKAWVEVGSEGDGECDSAN